ncbi:MAG: hypothetical protein K2O32_03580 [Acetatifactor sp.]|nr:hypothetical protein [Acetatifactor sp.]
MSAFTKLRKGIVGGIVGWVAMFVFVALIMFFMLFDYGGSYGELLMALVLGGFLVLVALIALVTYIIIAITGYGKAKGKLASIPGFSEERFAREVERCPQLRDTLICSDAICYQMDCITHVIPIREIVWVYQEERGRYGTAFTIYTLDGKRYQVPIRPCKGAPNADAAIRYLMRLIARKNKGALIGYKEEYEKLRMQSFGRLVMLTQGHEIVDSALLEQEYIRNDYYTKDLR